MQHKKLTMWTLISNLLIVIAGGHGGGPVGLLEIVSILNLLGLDNSFTINNLAASSLFWSIILILISQASIITALFIKKGSFYLKLAGILFLLVSYIILIAFVWNEGTASISIVTGMPFLVLSGILLYKHLTYNYEPARGDT